MNNTRSMTDHLLPSITSPTSSRLGNSFTGSHSNGPIHSNSFNQSFNTSNGLNSSSNKWSSPFSSRYSNRTPLSKLNSSNSRDNISANSKQQSNNLNHNNNNHLVNTKKLNSSGIPPPSTSLYDAISSNTLLNNNNKDNQNNNQNNSNHNNNNNHQIDNSFNDDSFHIHRPTNMTTPFSPSATPISNYSKSTSVTYTHTSNLSTAARTAAKNLGHNHIGHSNITRDELDDRWITVYGFPIASASFVLREFQNCGEVIRHKVGKGNWMTIQFATAQGTQRALAKNGKRLGNLMVGVVAGCDSSSFELNESTLATPMKSTSSTSHLVHNTSLTTAMTSRTVNSALNASSTATRAGLTPGHPLRQRTFRATNRDYDITSAATSVIKKPKPQRGACSKVLEYVFGW